MTYRNTIIFQYNWTSVMLAAKYGHDEVVKELVERGADLTITTVRAKYLYVYHNNSYHIIVSFLSSHAGLIPSFSLLHAEKAPTFLVQSCIEKIGETGDEAIPELFVTLTVIIIIIERG